MIKRGRSRRALIALIAVLAVAACNGGDPIAAPITTTTAPAPTTTTRTIQTLAQKQAAQAEDAVVAFWSVLDKLSRGETKSVTQLSAVARARALNQWRETLLEQRRKGWKQLGATAVEITNIEPAASQRYLVTVCLNYEEIDFVDRAGQSVLPKDRQTHDEDQYTVELTAAGDFLVDQRIDRKGVPC